MSEYTIAILIGLGGLVIGAIAFHAGRKIESLTQRIRTLEEANRANMPYHAMNGAEDITAGLLDLERYIEALEIRRQQVLSNAQRLRRDGANYDPNKPAGPRPEV